MVVIVGAGVLEDGPIPLFTFCITPGGQLSTPLDQPNLPLGPALMSGTQSLKVVDKQLLRPLNLANPVCSAVI